jgi:hypothetical protein
MILGITEEDIQKQWDDARISVLSAANISAISSAIKVELINRKLKHIDIAFSGIDEAVGDENLEAAKDHILDWTKKFGSVKIMSRGTSGILQLRISQ